MTTASALARHGSLDCAFGPFVPNLRLIAPDTLEIAIPTPAGVDVQRVAVAPVALRGGLAMLSWIEQDGTMVVHVHDYEAMLVHSHARLADGTLVRSVGTLAWRD